MIPFAIPLVLKNLPWRLIGIGAGVIAVLLACWWAVDAIGDSREEKVRAEYDAAQRAAEAKAAADTKLLQSAIAEIDTGITVDMEAIANVRTRWRDKVIYKAVDVYRDNPGCRVPFGLLSDINAAASGYAAAVTGAGNATVPAAKPPE
jgi:hypothetical protein